MSRLPRGKAWRALEGLEYDKRFKAACALAEAMLDTESSAEEQDVLKLVQARNRWLWRAGKDTNYSTLIREAMDASTPEVSAEARLWNEALSAPTTAQALQLSHQIWETIHFDCRYREKSARLVHVIYGKGQDIFDQVQLSDMLEEDKQFTLGRIVSIVSEIGFQLHNRPLLDWAVQSAEGLGDGADPEDKLTPLYYQSFNYYAGEQYYDAAAGFETVFLSHIPCDVAAEAGILLANCFLRTYDEELGLAAVEVLEAIYPDQGYALKKVRGIRDVLNARGNINEEEVVAYVDDYFMSKLPSATVKAPPSDPDKKVVAVSGK